MLTWDREIFFGNPGDDEPEDSELETSDPFDDDDDGEEWDDKLEDWDEDEDDFDMSEDDLNFYGYEPIEPSDYSHYNY